MMDMIVMMRLVKWKTTTGKERTRDSANRAFLLYLVYRK